MGKRETQLLMRVLEHTSHEADGEIDSDGSNS